jgi:hypothetical protein
MAVGVIDVAGATGRFVFTVYDGPYYDWADDCPPPPPRRWHAVAAPPPPRVVVDPPPCKPRFGINTNWSDSGCAKLHTTVAQVVPAERTTPPAPPPDCVLNLGINRNWLDANCAKLYADSPAQPAPAVPTPPPAASALRCELNLGVNRDWFDSNCAKLQPGKATGMDRLRDFFSSVVHPSDLQAYRPVLGDAVFATAAVIAFLIFAYLCARLVWWIFEGRDSRPRPQASNRVTLLTPDAASVRTRSEPSDLRARQARELADRANELQASLFGQPS